jgi:protein-S-isoprenylcysteine O-methyltransferase Ste14
MIRGALFLILSVCVAYISRASLRSPRSHGFYRFFAWECILLLFLLNVVFWFHDPFSWNQVIAWSFLFISLVPLAYGVQALIRRGKPGRGREEDGSLFAFEKTSQLVTSGIYRYIRHPLYSSLLWLTWGIFFKSPSWPGGALALVATLLLIATARRDEAECVRFFGPAYQEYMSKSKRFVPFLF